MVINKDSKNRCGIFLFYDRDGIVDDYITYMLKDLKKSMSFLMVVCNGSPSDEGIKKLEEASDEVYIRENSGFDVGGYRDGLFHIGWERLESFDEVVMLNYTFFGAIYPFEEAFQRMAEQDVDFWGLTKHHKVEYDPFGAISYGYLPEHIQSHFLVLRKDFLACQDYKDFIINLKNPTSYLESICGYEAIFTKRFEDMGYKWAVYDDTSRFEGYAYSPVMFYIKDMLEQDRCPIVKRRSFFTEYNDYLLNGCGEATALAYDYLRNHTDYDVNMIWDNILRLENMTEVSKVMQLSYFNCDDMSYTDRGLEDITVAVWVKSLECLEFYDKFLGVFSGLENVTLFGKNEEIDGFQAYLKERDISINAEIVAAELTGMQEFIGCALEHTDKAFVLIAVLDDKGTVKPYSNKMSNIYKDWSCLLSSVEYIGNVLDDFDDNERMGLGIPPVPDFGEYYASTTDGWMGRFDEVKSYLERLGIKPNIKPDIEPLFPLGGNFLLRTKAVDKEIWKKTLSEKVDDTVFLLALTELIQAGGFYTGKLYSDNYAAIELTNSDYMMRVMNKAVFEKYGPNYYSVVRDRIKNDEFIETQIAEQPKTWKTQAKALGRKVLPQGLYNHIRDAYRKIKG